MKRKKKSNRSEELCRVCRKEFFMLFIISIMLVLILNLLIVPLVFNFFVGGKPVFLKVSENLLRERPISTPDYDCDNLSRELVHRLNALGYQSKMVCGYSQTYPDTLTPHCWVKLDLYIEATTGKIIDINRYGEYILCEG